MNVTQVCMLHPATLGKVLASVLNLWFHFIRSVNNLINNNYNIIIYYNNILSIIIIYNNKYNNIIYNN